MPSAFTLRTSRGPVGERDRFVREIEFDSGLTDGQRRRLREIAERCPVHLLLDRADVSVVVADEELPPAVANGLHATEMEDACSDAGPAFLRTLRNERFRSPP